MTVYLIHSDLDPDPFECWACGDAGDVNAHTDADASDGAASVAEVTDTELICWCGHSLHYPGCPDKGDCHLEGESADCRKRYSAEAAAGERVATIEAPPPDPGLLMRALAEYVEARVRDDRFTLTIRHAQPTAPTPGMLEAAAEVIAAALQLAGIESEVTIVPVEPWDEDGGEGCLSDDSENGHHRISDSLCANCLEFI